MAYQTKFDGQTDKAVTLGKPGDPTTVEGYFLGTKITPDTGYGPGKLHIFQTSEGSIGVWGKTRLNTLLTPELVGQMTLVTFTGMVAPAKKGKRPSYGFKVQHDPSNKIDVAPLVSSNDATEPESDDVDESFTEEYSAPAVVAKAPSEDRIAKARALLAGKR